MVAKQLQLVYFEISSALIQKLAYIHTGVYLYIKMVMWCRLKPHTVVSMFGLSCQQMTNLDTVRMLHRLYNPDSSLV